MPAKLFFGTPRVREMPEKLFSTLPRARGVPWKAFCFVSRVRGVVLAIFVTVIFFSFIMGVLVHGYALIVPQV
jgi:hypothetical protein